MKNSKSSKDLNIGYVSIVAIVSSITILLLLIAIFFFSKNNMLVGMAALLSPIPFIFLYLVFKYPRLAFITSLYCNYFAIGLTRYVPAPMGLSVDLMLVFTFVTLIFSQFNHKVNWGLAAKDYTYWGLIWFGMTLMQLFNPEAVSREAWFYAMRGQAFYIVLTVPLVYIIFNKPKDLELLIKLCAWFTILAIAKGIMQKHMGVDRWEQQWLNVPGNRSTHILFGQLRVFSFFSDAGTYGGSMGYFGVLFSILGIYNKGLRKKLFYFAIALGAFYAMLISGTRSAIAVPLTGFVFYTILSKKFKIMFAVGTVVFAIFFFLKFTTIGQGNYDIRRMRSAFSEDNASMNVRVENRRLFSEYLKSRPFGGGIGSSGNWGHRFSPGTFLADTATDGWYIQLWAEQGIVGLIFYLSMLAYFVGKSCILIFFRLKKPENIKNAIALTSGMIGLMVSSYTASSLGQMPNTIIVFAGMTLISLMPEWENENINPLVKENTTIV